MVKLHLTFVNLFFPSKCFPGSHFSPKVDAKSQLLGEPGKACSDTETEAQRLPCVRGCLIKVAHVILDEKGLAGWTAMFPNGQPLLCSGELFVSFVLKTNLLMPLFCLTSLKLSGQETLTYMHRHLRKCIIFWKTSVLKVLQCWVDLFLQSEKNENWDGEEFTSVLLTCSMESTGKRAKTK